MLIDTDEKKRQESLNKFKNHLRFSKYLKTSLVGTETGCFNTTYTYTKLNDSEEAFIFEFKPINYAEEIQTNLAIEGVAKHIISTPEK